jgi:hypothetical protein
MGIAELLRVRARAMGIAEQTLQYRHLILPSPYLTLPYLRVRARGMGIAEQAS